MDKNSLCLQHLVGERKYFLLSPTTFLLPKQSFSTMKRVTLPVTFFHWTEMCVCHPLPGAGHPSARWSLGKGSHWECSPWLPPCSPAQSPPQAGPHQPHWWMGELQGAKVTRTLTQHFWGGCEIRLGLQGEGVKPPVTDKAIPWPLQLEQLSLTPRTAAELQLFTAHGEKERWKPIFQLFHCVLCHQNKRWFPRQDLLVTINQYFQWYNTAIKAKKCFPRLKHWVHQQTQKVIQMVVQAFINLNPQFPSGSGVLQVLQKIRAKIKKERKSCSQFSMGSWREN